MELESNLLEIGENSDKFVFVEAGGGAGHATVWKLVTLLFEYQDPIDLSKEVLMLITTTSAGQFEALLAS